MNLVVGGGITGQKIMGQLARYSLKHSIYLYLGHYGTGDYGTPRKRQIETKIKIFLLILIKSW